MILQFLVPQYNEDETVIKKLLDSIALQQHLDFKDVEMLICNDGSEILLSEKFLQQYPFNIIYIKEKHRGVSATRNTLLNMATADYILYCDADDMFRTTHDLYKVIDMLKNNICDGIAGGYIKEEINLISNEFMYNDIRELDHGAHCKFLSRKFLLERKIFWPEDLTINEDYYYLGLLYSEEPHFIFYNVPFYMYTHNPKSVTRKKEFNYLGETYIIEANYKLIKELLNRK